MNEEELVEALRGRAAKVESRDFNTASYLYMAADTIERLSKKKKRRRNRF